MSSILLSFVGQQDPVSDQTREDGSIVSLTRHLIAQSHPINRLVLLYTTGMSGTQDRAELTQAWLADAPFHLNIEQIDLIPVGDALSADPVDLWLAVQAAKAGLEQAIAHCNAPDTLELNGSSGTPVMKSAWSILQAAGYAPKSRLWQVRNPKEQQPGQARVFQTNIQILRQTFDTKIIEQQLKDYNYNGALTTLRASGLATPRLEALLRYGYCRLALDFAQAKAAVVPTMAGRWRQEMVVLLSDEPVTLLQEAYFNAVVELKNRQLSNFLVRMSQFYEQALQYFVDQQLSGAPALPDSFGQTQLFWEQLAQQQPALFDYLQQYRFRGHPLRLEAFPSRPVFLAILEYGQPPVLLPLQSLSTVYDQRNRYIHQFEGISELDDADQMLRVMRQILSNAGIHDFNNPFNALNQEIVSGLKHEISLSPHV